jgi:hypothetical protein
MPRLRLTRRRRGRRGLPARTPLAPLTRPVLTPPGPRARGVQVSARVFHRICWHCHSSPISRSATAVRHDGRLRLQGPRLNLPTTPRSWQAASTMRGALHLPPARGGSLAGTPSCSRTSSRASWKRPTVVPGCAACRSACPRGPRRQLVESDRSGKTQ